MAHSEVIETRLVLVSARKSRGADYWDKDDYDVRLGNASGRVVGRIFRQPRAPKEQPWFWTITAREQPPSVYNRGYAASREQAMRYFKARYIRPAAFRWSWCHCPDRAGRSLRGQPPPPFPRLAPGKGALSPPPGQQSALRDCSPPVHLTLHVLERRRQFGNTAFGQFCTQAQLQIRSQCMH